MISRLIVDPDGRILDYKLNRPFGYLGKLASDPSINLNGQGGSSKVLFGVPVYTGVAELITLRYGVIGDLYSLSISSFVAYSLRMY
jgi:hypothetical protein